MCYILRTTEVLVSDECVGSNASLSGFVLDIFCYLSESNYFETQTSLYLDTFCLLYRCVCVRCFIKQGGERELSLSFFYVFSPSTIFLCVVSVYVYVCGKVCGRFHGTVPTLHSTSLHPFPLFHLFSLIYPSILFRPSVAAAPLFLSITPAVMRLNLSVSTGHTHTLYTLFRAVQCTHT